MTNEELFDKLRPIILQATGVPEVIWGNQYTPEDDDYSPAGEYASIFIRQSVVERGQAIVVQRDKVGDLVETDVRAQVIASCSVNFYRGNAHQYAERLKQCNKHPGISIALFMAGLGWNGADSVNDLTALQASAWEPRAQVTIRLMYEVLTRTDINNILSASVRLLDAETPNVLAEFNVP